MALDKVRLAESEQLIRAYLVKNHEDGDVNSLSVRFGELTQEIERLQLDNEAWVRMHAKVRACTEKRAPVQGEPNLLPNVGRYTLPPGTVAWAEHEAAWEAYAEKVGRGQSAERMAERGGFSYTELCAFLGHPPSTWRQGR